MKTQSMHYQWNVGSMHVYWLHMHDCMITKFNLFCYSCDHRHSALSQLYFISSLPSSKLCIWKSRELYKWRSHASMLWKLRLREGWETGLIIKYSNVYRVNENPLLFWFSNKELASRLAIVIHLGHMWPAQQKIESEEGWWEGHMCLNLMTSHYSHWEEGELTHRLTEPPN